MATAMKRQTRRMPRREAGDAAAHRHRLGGMPDHEVVQLSLEGDARAFAEIVTRYDQRLLNFVYRTIGDRERAQDLVQELSLIHI